MFIKLKRFFYFAVAWYFRIFAEVRLRAWCPKVVVITGSSGKTTLLHLVESQLGDKAKYSHHANSSIGIPFDILGLHRVTLTIWEWPSLFLKAPLRVFSSLPKEKIYIVEADCDRPHEGRFLSSLLKPDITLWTNVSRTHAVGFDYLVKRGLYQKVEEAIAFEFGYFAEQTKKLVIINGDDLLQEGELGRVSSEIKKTSVTKKLREYEITTKGTTFKFDDYIFNFKYLLPKEVADSILMVKELVSYLDLKFDKNFSKFELPPGRSSLFKGIRNTTIIDSTYNANLGSVTAIINMFSCIRAKEKWIVIGDMLELGAEEKEEHEKLADLLVRQRVEKIILMGPRVVRYTSPKLLKSKVDIVTFQRPKEVLDYLIDNIKGGETILFKGARFLEGVIEKLLLDRKEASKLDRREKIWEIRRKKWGL